MIFGYTTYKRESKKNVDGHLYRFIPDINRMSTSEKTDPIPVKLDWATKRIVDQLKRKSGLSRSEVLRRAIRFSAPKFLSGEASILEAGATEK